VGIKNKQPKDTGNTGHKTQNEHKQNKQTSKSKNKQAKTKQKTKKMKTTDNSLLYIFFKCRRWQFVEHCLLKSIFN